MANDLWRTPKPFFDYYALRYCMVADMACSTSNKTMNLGYTEKDDSLSFDWADRVNKDYTGKGNHYVWCNPPYSNPLPWIISARQAQKKGLGVIMLLNSDTSVGWFIEALKTVSEIQFLIGSETPERAPRFPYKPGRIAFIDGDGEPIGSNNKPQLVLVFDPYKIGTCQTSYIPLQHIMNFFS